MRDFVAQNAGLILELAREAVAARREPIAPEDIAQEMIASLIERSADPTEVRDAVPFLRPYVAPAIARARSRRRLIERIAEGADLTEVAEQATRIDVETIPSSHPMRTAPIERALPEVKLAPRVALAARVDPSRVEHVIAAWTRAGVEPVARGPGRVVAFVDPARESALVGALAGVPHDLGRAEARLVSPRATDRLELAAWRALETSAAPPTRSVILRDTRTRKLTWVAGIAAVVAFAAAAMFGAASTQPKLDVARAESPAGVVLSFAPGTPQEEATLVAFDANGANVGPPLAFARDPSQTLRLVVPPGEVEGAAVGFVIAGEPANVAGALVVLTKPDPSVRTLADRETLVRAQAHARNLRVARIAF